jgi:protein SCO1/2
MKYLALLGLLTALWACGPETPRDLPILGHHEVVDGDTAYHTIPAFSFLNQDSQRVTKQTFAGKAYVVDFFFISCPTICPMLTKQMKRIHDRFETEERLLLLSHTIDPKHDTIPRLAHYAGNLGVTSEKWHFVTGTQDSIYSIADDYFSIAVEDPTVPGGFDHSGRIILVDGQGRIRSFCNGTDPESVDTFMDDIDLLLSEMRTADPLSRR